MRFLYSLIRFVPDPGRGEFVNVGAIVGSDSSGWQIRQIENPVRARRLDDNSLLDGVWSFMDRVGSKIDQYEQESESLFGPGMELGEDWLDTLYRDHQNIVQLSPPTPVAAESADEAMDRIFELLIVDPASRKYRFQKKNVALAAVRSAYREKSIRKGIDVRERVQLMTPHHNGRFDFAITNGHVLQLTQTFSFQVPNQEELAEQIKAWGWTVHDAQLRGGNIATAQGETFQVESDVDFEVVYIAPQEGKLAPALTDAINIFDELSINAHEISDVGSVATRAKDLLVAAGTGHLGIG